MRWMRQWYCTIFRKKMVINEVRLHASVAIEGASNFIEWKGVHILSAYVETNSETKKVNGTRYYFKNDAAHKNILLVLKGWRSQKKVSYKLNPISVFKKEMVAPVFVSREGKLSNKRLYIRKTAALKTPVLVLDIKRQEQMCQEVQRTVALKTKVLQEKLKMSSNN